MRDAASMVGTEGYPPNPTAASGASARNSLRAAMNPSAISAAAKILLNSEAPGRPARMRCRSTPGKRPPKA